MNVDQYEEEMYIRKVMQDVEDEMNRHNKGQKASVVKKKTTPENNELIIRDVTAFPTTFVRKQYSE